MKLSAERTEGTNAIARHSLEGVVINGQAHTQHIVVPWQGEVFAWATGGFEGLSENDFGQLLALKPELVVFGSGRRLRFAPPRLQQALMASRVGIETMDTAAACRTYNVLLAEGRKVVAALLFDAPPASQG
ncbi:MAG: Mth938-like domain-containing protein [Burkholderiales bacterium]